MIVEFVNNLTIIIEGKLIASKNVRAWPQISTSKRYWSFMTFWGCDNLTLRGGGKIDGRGYHWWILTLLNYKSLLNSQGDRPHLIQILKSRNTIIHDLTIKNSPQFHLKMDDCNTA